MNPAHQDTNCRRVGCGQCKFIRQDAGYAAAFSGRRPSWTAAAPAARRPLSCVHEGAVLEWCQTCGPNGGRHVRDCALHDRCTREFVSDRVRSCDRCPDRRAEPETDPHPGRFLAIPEPPPGIVTVRPTSRAAVVTYVVGDDAERMHAASGPSQAAFARSVGADYVVLRWNPLPADFPMACKYGLWACLADGLWDVVLGIDTDVLPRPGCVNPIALTAPGHFGIYDERPFHIVQPQHDCEAAYDRLRARMGYPAERPAIYGNCGVVVVPRSHRRIVAPPARLWVEHEGTGRHCAEQNATNAALWYSGLPFHLLDRRANWQGWPDKGLADAPPDALLHWSGGPERHRRAERIAEVAAAHPWP